MTIEELLKDPIEYDGKYVLRLECGLVTEREVGNAAHFQAMDRIPITALLSRHAEMLEARYQPLVEALHQIVKGDVSTPALAAMEALRNAHSRGVNGCDWNALTALEVKS